MAAPFPKAKATIFEDAGHYVLEDAHERIIPLIGAFIDDTSSTARGLSSSSGSRSDFGSIQIQIQIQIRNRARFEGLRGR